MGRPTESFHTISPLTDGYLVKKGQLKPATSYIVDLDTNSLIANTPHISHDVPKRFGDRNFLTKSTIAGMAFLISIGAPVGFHFLSGDAPIYTPVPCATSPITSNEPTSKVQSDEKLAISPSAESQKGYTICRDEYSPTAVYESTGRSITHHENDQILIFSPSSPPVDETAMTISTVIKEQKGAGGKLTKQKLTQITITTDTEEQKNAILESSSQFFMSDKLVKFSNNQTGEISYYEIRRETLQNGSQGFIFHEYKRVH